MSERSGESPLWDRIADSLGGVRRRASELPDELVTAIADKLSEAGYKMRYGMSPEEFRQRMVAGEVPGSTPNPSDRIEDREQRRAAAYYFAKEHPVAAPILQPLINKLKKSGVPFLSDDPSRQEELEAAARQGSTVGVEDALREDPRNAVNYDSGFDFATALAAGPAIDAMDAAGNKLRERYPLFPPDTPEGNRRFAEMTGHAEPDAEPDADADDDEMRKFKGRLPGIPGIPGTNPFEIE